MSRGTRPARPEVPRKDPVQILPLQNGDHLTREEFERRYEAMPHLKKAELIEGVVYLHSAVKYEDRSRPQTRLLTWLAMYEPATPGVEASDNPTLRLGLDNDPQPDALLRITPAAGGRSRIGQEGYVEGPPELVAEVAASSASYDLHAKLHVYRRSGVQEYLVWRVLDREIDWFSLREGQYQKMTADALGIFRSEVFPGLWLDPAALLNADLAAVLKTLERGLADPSHAAFAERLRESSGR